MPRAIEQGVLFTIRPDGCSCSDVNIPCAIYQREANQNQTIVTIGQDGKSFSIKGETRLFEASMLLPCEDATTNKKEALLDLSLTIHPLEMSLTCLKKACKNHT